MAKTSRTWYGDSAYGTGELRGEIERAGHRAVIKPKPVQPAVADGFTLDDFTVDESCATVTCPAGQTRPLSATQTVTFGALCHDCPLRAACTTAKAGRTMVLHERDDLLRAARADWAADPALREDYRTYRPNVERTVSQVATQSGRRIKLRYRGTTKNNTWLKCRTAALNLRNLIGHGLTRVDRTWSWPPDRPQRPGTTEKGVPTEHSGQPNHEHSRPIPAVLGPTATTHRQLPGYRAHSGRHHRAHEPASSASSYTRPSARPVRRRLGGCDAVLLAEDRR